MPSPLESSARALRAAAGSVAAAATTRLHGVGVDIVHVPRIQAAVARWGARFLARACHPREAARAAALPPAAAAYFVAGRWAAKEALHKALRGGAAPRLAFADVEVGGVAPPQPGPPHGAGPLPAGQPASGRPPEFVFHGAAAAGVQALALRGAHVSISHDGEYAVAFVVAEGYEVGGEPAACCDPGAEAP